MRKVNIVNNVFQFFSRWVKLDCKLRRYENTGCCILWVARRRFSWRNNQPCPTPIIRGTQPPECPPPHVICRIGAVVRMAKYQNAHRPLDPAQYIAQVQFDGNRYKLSRSKMPTATGSRANIVCVGGSRAGGGGRQTVGGWGNNG